MVTVKDRIPGREPLAKSIPQDMKDTNWHAINNHPNEQKEAPAHNLLTPQILKNASHIQDHPTYCHPFYRVRRLASACSDPVPPFLDSQEA